MIGRMDCKAARRERLLQINNIWLEPALKLTDPLISALAVALLDYMADLQTDNLIIRATHPKSLRLQLTIMTS